MLHITAKENFSLMSDRKFLVSARYFRQIAFWKFGFSIAVECKLLALLRIFFRIRIVFGVKSPLSFLAVYDRPS